MFPGDRGQAALPSHLVLPQYDGRSIANIAPTLASILGATMDGASPPLAERHWGTLAQDVTRVILLILDAVGYRQLESFVSSEQSVLNHLIEAGTLLQITSVFPSTTVSALTSIWTGQPPLGHGFLGTKLLLPQQGVLANLLRMVPAVYPRGGRLEDWGWNPDDFVAAPTLAGQLSSQGIKTIAHTRRSFLSSTLTRIFLQGMDDVQGYLGLSDLWLNVRRSLREGDPEQPLFVDIYWGGVDGVGHAYGPGTEYAPAALRHFSRSLEEGLLSNLTPDARANTLLVLTADHGQVATPADRVVYLPEHQELGRTLLLPPAGESRAAYLYVQPGATARAHCYVATQLADRFISLDTDAAVAAGLWGASRLMTPEKRGRLGDLIMLATGDSRLSTRRREDSWGILRGHHGSLTEDEMLVPLILTRLDWLSLP